MRILQTVLLSFLLVIAIYTLLVVQSHGMNLFPVFFGDLLAMTWRGQFNLDFMCFLALSALWVMWRNGFSKSGLALGILAFFGGMLFLSIYLLLLMQRPGASLTSLLLGVHHTK